MSMMKRNTPIGGCTLLVFTGTMMMMREWVGLSLSRHLTIRERERERERERDSYIDAKLTWLSPAC